MNEARLLLISIFLLGSLLLGVFIWFYYRKVVTIATSLQMEITSKIRALLLMSFFITAFTAVVSIIFLIFEML